LIGVLIVDDHAVVRAGLEQLLQTAEDIELRGSAGDGAQALAMVLEREPDVVLMDLSMPGIDGVEATATIRAARPATRVVVLTSFSDRDRILSALDAGAIGYLLKDAEPADLLAGIRAAARDESPLSPKAARAVLDRQSGRRPAADMTDRERQVLALVGAGLANKIIARRLNISEKTVKAHLTSIFRQIDVTDRTQAALWAREHGLVDDGANSPHLN
jgi:DNA-binding NarL/FixJ family response regulator